MAANNTSPSSGTPLPTLDEIHRAIPSQGIKINDFTDLFRARLPAEESFRTLFLLANTVARFDYELSMIWPKSRPSEEEVRAALKQNGIHFEEFVGLFGWNDMPDEKRARVARYLDQIAVPDMATLTIKPGGNVTAETMIAAIPDEGIAKWELELKIKEFTDPTPSELWNAFKILAQVAVWDVYTEKIFRRDGTA